MSNMGNSNLKIIAAAFAAALVVGGGAVFALKGLSPSLPAGPAASAPAGEAAGKDSGGFLDGLMQKVRGLTNANSETPAQGIETIVALAKNHDAAGYKARVKTDFAATLAVNAIKGAWPEAAKTSDDKLKQQVLASFDTALAGKTPPADDASSFVFGALALKDITYTGIANVEENNGAAIVDINLASKECLPDGYTLRLVLTKNDQGQWIVQSISKAEAYVNAIRDGQKAAEKRFYEQYVAIGKRYQEAMAAINGKYVTRSDKYCDEYAAADKELRDSIAALPLPPRLSGLTDAFRHRSELVDEHIRLIRAAYAAKDNSKSTRQDINTLAGQIREVNQIITNLIKSIQ